MDEPNARDSAVLAAVPTGSADEAAVCAPCPMTAAGLAPDEISVAPSAPEATAGRAWRTARPPEAPEARGSATWGATTGAAAEATAPSDANLARDGRIRRAG
jgi:hypothetical protein